MKKIAIVGSTGMLGQPVTKAFIKAGYEVTVLVRDREKAIKFFGPGVKIVQGDLKSIKSLEQAFEGQDCVYLSLSVEQQSTEKQFQPERDGIDNVLAVAKQKGIKRVGYLSSLVQYYQGQNGFYWWAFDIKQKSVEKLKSSGLTYSIFYPSTFMESFERGAYRNGDTIFLAGKSKYKMYMIAGDDYARQVVNAFELDNGNQEYVIQGTEGFTVEEGAKLLAEKYTKTKLKVVKIPFGFLKLVNAFGHKLDYAVHILDALNNYPEKFEGEKAWEELGKPQISLIEYARQA